MATVFVLLFGIVIGLIGMGGANVSFSPQGVGMLGRYAWWIVFLSMLVPLADYLSGMRTTLTGVLTGHPFRHVAGFSSSDTTCLLSGSGIASQACSISGGTLTASLVVANVAAG